MNEFKKLKILVADDEKSNLDVLIHILKNDYTLFPVKTGKAALKKAADVIPDLILLDIIMPDMNGFEVLEKLKADELTAHIPVIFITGLTSAEDEKKGLKLGAADYIIKPFNSEVVITRVNTHMKLVRQARVMEELGMVEELTYIYNRKSFDRQLTIEWARALREKNPLSLIMVELNNREQLSEAAKIIKANLKRTTDIAARYRENVFSIILSNTPREGADKIAEDIKTSLSSLGDDIVLGIGVSTEIPGAHNTLSYFVLSTFK